MYAQETNDAEVPEHAVQGTGPVFASDGRWVGVFFHGGELGGDFGALDERVEDIEDGVATPGVGVVAQEGKVVFAGRIRGSIGVTSNTMTVAAEGFELVDEFVDDIPGPE